MMQRKYFKRNIEKITVEHFRAYSVYVHIVKHYKIFRYIRDNDYQEVYDNDISDIARVNEISFRYFKEEILKPLVRSDVLIELDNFIITFPIIDLVDVIHRFSDKIYGYKDVIGICNFICNGHIRFQDSDLIEIKLEKWINMVRSYIQVVPVLSLKDCKAAIDRRTLKRQIDKIF